MSDRIIEALSQRLRELGYVRNYNVELNCEEKIREARRTRYFYKIAPEFTYPHDIIEFMNEIPKYFSEYLRDDNIYYSFYPIVKTSYFDWQIVAFEESDEEVEEYHDYWDEWLE